MAALSAVAFLLVSCAADPPISPEPATARNLVLLTVDTWRADHFATSVGGEDLTPRLRRLAASGTRFPSAHSAGNETSPGTAGILTGLSPQRAGVSINLHVLKAEVPSLAPILSRSGFRSAGIVANPVLRPGTGFGLGFDSYELVPGEDGPWPKPPAAAVTDAALARLDEIEGAERFFLWVHYLDPHGPYRPPPDWRDRFPVDRFGEEARDVPLLEPGDHSGVGGVPAYQQLGFDPVPKDARSYLARYAAEVAYLDHEIGRLLTELERRGHLEDSLIVLTSDHGEALAGEHGHFFSHANGLTQDQIHVPLVLAGPGVPAGRVIEKPVSNLGVLPTILELLAVSPPEDHVLDGENLLNDRRQDVLAVSGRSVSLRIGDWKAIWDPGAPARLYDLDRDPGEARDVATERPGRLEELTRRLRDLRSRPPVTRPTSRGDLPEEERKALEALGYV